MNDSAQDSDHPPSCVAIVDDTGSVAEIDVEWLQSTLDLLVRQFGTPVLRLALRIVGDAEMSEAHERFSGIAGPTDVLTFVSSTDPIDVDVLLCRDEAQRRSTEFAHSTTHELLLYALHGLLHAAGHDDKNPTAFARMHAEEDRLLSDIGVGELFDPHRREEGSL